MGISPIQLQGARTCLSFPRHALPIPAQNTRPEFTFGVEVIVSPPHRVSQLESNVPTSSLQQPRLYLISTLPRNPFYREPTTELHALLFTSLPVSESTLDLNFAEDLLPKMPEAEQTNNGEYEMIKEEHTFVAVNFDRYMSWKAGDGHIRMGIRTIKTDTDEENMILSQGWSVVVTKTNFKLVNTY